jgi:hypothetical protein
MNPGRNYKILKIAPAQTKTEKEKKMEGKGKKK